LQQKHSLLKRQIKKYFGDQSNIPKELQSFLGAVDAAYQQFDMDREMVERSLELSSQELLQANLEMTAVVHGSPIPQFVIDRNHKVTHWNRALEEATRIRAEEVIGTAKHWKAFYSQERPCMADLLVDGSIERVPELYGEKYNKSRLVPDAYEMTDYFPALGKKGAWLYCTATAIRDSNGNVIGALESLEDITERKRMEDELRLYSEHLEELVAEKTKQLRQAERMAAIGEVAAMVAHDLRNPLQGIAGALGVIRQNLGSAADSLSVKMLDLIESSVGYAGNIIKDLVDYSREVRLEPTETTPKSVTETALLQIKIPENVAVRDLTQERPKILIDVPKMQRVFVNLLRNAIEAMPKGGLIMLSSSESNGILEMRVTDTGDGISESVLQDLWKPFKTTKPRGTGLGLAISKRVVEAHGGAIKVESTVGKGSTFIIAIPINCSASMRQTKPEDVAVSSPLLVN
jgi:PAS domain S-box-containing protein